MPEKSLSNLANPAVTLRFLRKSGGKKNDADSPHSACILYVTGALGLTKNLFHITKLITSITLHFWRLTEMPLLSQFQSDFEHLAVSHRGPLELWQ